MQDGVRTASRPPVGNDGRAGWSEVDDDGPDPVEDRPIVETALTAGLPPLLPDLFINRELSWLEFNRRVLDEARDATTPLLERAKFAAIFASNLNEFFMIRVAGVKRKIAAGIGDPGPDGRTPTQALTAIQALTQALLDDQAALLRLDLLPKLAEAGVEIVDYDHLEDEARRELTEWFDQSVFPILTPQAIDRGRRFPHVSNRSINLIVSLRLPVGARFARIKIPATLPRLVPIATPAPGVPPGRLLRFTWLEQVVSAHLDRLFAGADVLACHPFHVTRDSDIELQEEEDLQEDLMMTMRDSIAQRAFGPVARLMVDASMPEDVRDWVVEHLHATDRDLYVVDGPLATEDLFDLLGIDRPDLKDPPFTPARVPAFHSRHAEDPVDIFAVLRDGDVLVHHPYQTFATVADFIRAASSDPDVVAIKQTLYRIGRDSPLVPALIAARDDDTQVAVLVELKARFDEENNITWAEQLEDQGVHVAYGLLGLKTHCKVTLVVRREAVGLRRYVHLGTGNYNASTARLYEDLGLFTSREDLGSDATDLFNVLTGYATKERYRKLWVAPHHLRERFLEAIEREIASHEANGGGYLCFKVNALVDKLLIRALYKAARAGVRIDLIVRGACCLRPGIPGWSETIRVISVVGRFLEHSRVYVFGNGGANEVYLGSADLMERNLDRRVE
ncbi:MAG TPA: polyphosphate kinase 1, partial [Thermomicrobiales bacterium]|nr:polyphosphate kinase 1 [Thermomicrobiales bacterium]